jgi:hypothetical protein
MDRELADLELSYSELTKVHQAQRLSMVRNYRDKLRQVIDHHSSTSDIGLAHEMQ